MQHAQLQLAMERQVAFWKRRMSDQILVSFDLPSPSPETRTAAADSVADTHPPLFDDVPKMLRDFEATLPDTVPERAVQDDTIGIPGWMADQQFGNGLTGAMFGATLQIASTRRHTMTFNAPVIREWSDLASLRFDAHNAWCLRCLDCLRYITEHASKPFLLSLMVTNEGANFAVSMRGETQALFDFADQAPQVRQLYELGLESGARFFELRRAIVKAFNERLLGRGTFSDLHPYFGVPWTDTDTDALCAPAVFARHGLEFKQKMIDRFNGGMVYIHALGLHLVPVIGQVKRMTQLSFADDPKCPHPFDRRVSIRNDTFDTPLYMACEYGEFIAALRAQTLPGGMHYAVSVPAGVNVSELNHVMDTVRGYRSPGRLAGVAG